MSNVIEYAPGLAIAVVALGLLVYAIAAAIALFSSEWWLREQLRGWFVAAPAQNIGIPCAAISAFAVVAVLLRTFPPTPGVDGPLGFKAFGLEFSGPSGPITLWLVCFLGFVFALKLLRAP